MGKRLTDKEYYERVLDAVGLEYKMLTKFKGVHKKVLMYHEVCGNAWMVEAKAFIGIKGKKGSRCPFCYGNVRLTTKQYQDKLNKLGNNEYELLSEYVNAHKLVKIRHKVCGITYMQAPMSFLAGSRCKYCSGDSSCNEYIDYKLKRDTGDEFTRVSNYIDAGSYIDIKHNVCGNIFKTTGMKLDVYKVPRCPKCFVSHGEANIATYLRMNNIKFEPQKKFEGLKRLSYDFYVPKFNTLIEYQGKQHYDSVNFFGGDKTLSDQKERDSRKKVFAKDKGYKLLEIPYTISSYNAICSYLKENL